jgi:hypothetical protein
VRCGFRESEGSRSSCLKSRCSKKFPPTEYGTGTDLIKTLLLLLRAMRMEAFLAVLAPHERRSIRVLFLELIVQYAVQCETFWGLGTYLVAFPHRVFDRSGLYREGPLRSAMRIPSRSDWHRRKFGSPRPHCTVRYFFYLVATVNML